jgi:hypothetical protein
MRLVAYSIKAGIHYLQHSVKAARIEFIPAANKRAKRLWRSRRSVIVTAATTTAAAATARSQRNYARRQ